jgi:Tfp pilus assembly protein PilO
MFKDKIFRKRFILSLSITIIGIFALGVILIFLGVKLSSLTNKIISEKSEIASGQRKLETLTLLTKDAERATRYINIIENTLPTRDNLIVFPREIKIMAESAGIRAGFDFGSETSLSTIAASIGFQLSIEGSLEKILVFFKEMEKSRFLIKTNNIDLEKSGETLNGILIGQIYFRT